MLFWRAWFSEPVRVADREVSVECSIGIAVVPAAHEAGPPITVDGLLRNADVAMYQAKATDGSTSCHFRPEMNETLMTQLVRALLTDRSQ